MLYLAKFKEVGDVLIEAASPDDALRSLEAHDVADEPIRLVEVPAGVFCAEVQWADPSEVEAGESPAGLTAADVADAGVVLEPFEAFADWLDIEQKSSSVLDVVTPDES